MSQIENKVTTETCSLF